MVSVDSFALRSHIIWQIAGLLAHVYVAIDSVRNGSDGCVGDRKAFTYNLHELWPFYTLSPYVLKKHSLNILFNYSKLCVQIFGCINISLCASDEREYI